MRIWLEREVIKFLCHRSEKKVGESIRQLEIQLRLADRSLYPLTGSIDFIDNKVDAMTRTIRVRAVFDNSKFALASGMYASVQVPVAPDQNNPTETRAILVPAEVIMRDIGGSYVWVVDEGNIVHRRAVDVGDTIVKPADGDQHAVRQTIILDGLKVEDTIIISGLQRARDGAPVTPKTK